MSYPPPGWSEVGPECGAAVYRAGELLHVLGPGDVVDEDLDGVRHRFFAYEDGAGGRAVACLRQDASLMGDGAAQNFQAATASSNDATWFWLAILGLVGLAIGIDWYRSRGAAGGRLEDSRSAYRGWERRRERDDFAVQNIPEELLPLWQRTRGQFKGSPHERSEAFLEYAETDEGQREAIEARQEDADRELEADLERRQPGCTCKDEDTPRCCGRGCCSHHQGVRGRSQPGDRGRRVYSEVPF